MPNFTLHNHRELFRRIADGDEQAFTKVFLHYSRQLFPFILKKLKDEQLAKEVMQDIFFRLWLNRNRVAGFENPEGWLYRVAANAVLDHFRHLAQVSRLFTHCDMEEFITDHKEYAGIDFRETQKQAEEAIRHLPARRKAIYELRQQGLTYEEISQKFHVSVNTIKNQLISANRFVRDFLLAQGISPMIFLLLPHIFFFPE